MNQPAHPDIEAAEELQLENARRAILEANFRAEGARRLAWHLLQRLGGRATFDAATLKGPFGPINVRDAGEGQHEFIAGAAT